MYAVVGCGECGALWVVAGRPETTGCPRCGTRHRYRTLRKFAETDHEDAARQARATLLAERQGEGEAFADLDSFAAMGDRLDEAGPSDEEYLAGKGVDPDAVAAAGERRRAGRRSGSASPREVVLAAIEAADAPTEQAIVEHAERRDVPPGTARSTLEKLVRAGEVTESRGRYRRL